LINFLIFSLQISVPSDPLLWQKSFISASLILGSLLPQTLNITVAKVVSAQLVMNDLDVSPC